MRRLALLNRERRSRNASISCMSSPAGFISVSLSGKKARCRSHTLDQGQFTDPESRPRMAQTVPNLPSVEN